MDYIIISLLFFGFGFLSRYIIDMEILKKAKSDMKRIEGIQSKAYKKGYRSGITGGRYDNK